MNAATPQPTVPVSSAEAELAFAALQTQPRLLVAVSGGPDSVALLALLADWCRDAGRPALHAATVDHGLRPDSAVEAASVGTLCARLGVPHATLLWAGAKPMAALQDEARRARYALLAAEAARIGGAALVIAHTQDDQAETLLMRMAHGSGPAGLAGMKASSRRDGIAIHRPLLGFPKTRLVATAVSRALPFVSDPSNLDPRFERVRWRALMPALAEEGLTATRLAGLATRLARLDAAAEHRAVALLPALLSEQPGEGARLDFRTLAAEPEEIVLRVLAAALARLAPDGAELRRLSRLEACQEALLAALQAGRRESRTLAGCRLDLDAGGGLRLRLEPPRRRGIHPAAP